MRKSGGWKPRGKLGENRDKETSFGMDAPDQRILAMRKWGKGHGAFFVASMKGHLRGDETGDGRETLDGFPQLPTWNR